MTTVEQVRHRGFRVALRLGQWAAMPTAPLRSHPDFMVIGAQRCGTTSLYRLLSQHPGIRFPRLTKGTHWFDEEYQRSDAWYRSNFPLDAIRERSGRRLGYPVVVGEACPYYLFHPQGPARMQSAQPSARLIAILRDPVARAWSAYQHELRRGYESLPFEAALDAEPGRVAGAEEQLATRGSRHFSHQHHSYVGRGRYSEQLRRLWSVIDRDRTLVLYTDELERDPHATLARIHAFLGLPPHHATATEQRWNQQSDADVPAAQVGRLREAFATSDQWLGEQLDPAPPWLR